MSDQEVIVVVNYLLDTNIISAMMKRNEQVLKKLDLVEFAEEQIFISTITYYETKRGLLATQATQKMKEFNKLRQKYEMLGTDDEIVLDKASEIYAHLKQRGEILPDADILIAAVALTQDLTLVTADNHFDRIEELRVENWLKGDVITSLPRSAW